MVSGPPMRQMGQKAKTTLDRIAARAATTPQMVIVWLGDRVLGTPSSLRFIRGSDKIGKD